jgi:hypothetical protein
MDRHRARRLLVVALAVGILAEVLFRGPALGLNLVVLTGVALAAAWRFRRPGRAPDVLDAWLPVAALVLAALVAVRADPFLAALDTFGALACLGLSAVAFSGLAVTRRSASIVVAMGLWVGALVALGALRVLGTARREPSSAARRRPAWLAPVGRGLILGIPLALIMATLFASADPIFRRGLDDVLGLRIDLGELPGRALFAVAAAWLVAGFLAIAAHGIPEPLPGPASGPLAGTPITGSSLGAASRTAERGWSGARGPTEAIVVLAIVDAVALLFVGLQVGYLFGGLDTLAAIGMTYADYARRGYFELVAAAGLAGGILVGLDLALVRRPVAYIALALSLVVLTVAVLVSAAVRLDLYQDAYGWTELRLYVAASIAAMAVTLVVLAALLLTDRTRWLGHGMVAIGLVALIGLNALAPAAFVAERNVARVLDPSLVPADGWSGLDTDYLAVLPDDAIPVLADALPRLPAEYAGPVRDLLEARSVELATDPAYAGLAAWNLGRARAREALARTLGE